MPQKPDLSGSEPPSGKRLAASAAIAAVIAAIVLVTFVLPAEYGIDPLGAGRMLGLTQMAAAPPRTVEIANVIGGNEAVTTVEIPEFGQPVPLPNPAVHQDEPQPARTDTLEIVIPPEQETEIKMLMRTAKAAVYSWSVNRGTIYSDFHGHTPEAGSEFFVRYIEHQEAAGDGGSLVAPFDGEHGWYWLNYNDFPVTVTLKLTGYYDDIRDYGIF